MRVIKYVFPITPLFTLSFIQMYIFNCILFGFCIILGSRYTSAVSAVGELIRTGKVEIKIRALHCFASLIDYSQDPKAPQSGPIDHRVTLMTREWFRSLSVKPESMEILHEICKNPFPDIRLAAFNLLNAVCSHRWGEELVAKTPGMYILNTTIIIQLYYPRP